MSDSHRFELENPEQFLKSVGALLDVCYPRDGQNRQKCKDVLFELVTDILADPASRATQEPWPGVCFDPPWIFWKARFKLPGLHGARRLCRLMFLSHRDVPILRPVLFYTHAQFENRPKDRDLQRMLKKVVAAEPGLS